MARFGITGTATFEKVEITTHPEANEVEVTGYYHGDTTEYRGVAGSVFIGGLEVTVEGEGSLFVGSDDDDEWVYVRATEEDTLEISSEEPASE